MGRSVNRGGGLIVVMGRVGEWARCWGVLGLGEGKGGGGRLDFLLNCIIC